MHLSGCRYVTLRGLKIRGCSVNGLNADDGGGAAINVNQIVPGTILRVEEDLVLVDVGHKSEGIIPLNEWEEEEEQPSVGDKNEVLIEDIEGASHLLPVSEIAVPVEQVGGPDEMSDRDLDIVAPPPVKGVGSIIERERKLFGLKSRD